jgi:FkbM family methyltransferase
VTQLWARRLLRRLLPKPVALRLRQEWIARTVAAGGGHLEGEVFVLPTLVKPGDVCWDIGANAGMYTVALSKLARQVIAFEPVPHNFDTLRQATRLARLTNVELHAMAISDSRGRARFSVPVEQGFYGGYYMAAFHDTGELEVATETVDSLIAQGLAEPDFIKCDVEQAEERVVNGSRDLIRRRPPIWLLEALEPPLVSLMESLGYVTYIRAADNTLCRASGWRDDYRNYIFLPGVVSHGAGVLR